jgi:hypothetical protein
VVTHRPGLVYPAALNAIVGAAATPPGAGAVPTTSSGGAWRLRVLRLGVRPGRLDGPAEQGRQAGLPHGREIVVAVVGVIGVYLFAKGLSILRGR